MCSSREGSLSVVPTRASCRPISWGSVRRHWLLQATLLLPDEPTRLGPPADANQRASGRDARSPPPRATSYDGGLEASRGTQAIRGGPKPPDPQRHKAPGTPGHLDTSQRPRAEAMLSIARCDPSSFWLSGAPAQQPRPLSFYLAGRG
ncbi:hypothetical protein VULLAG_LOCUS21701 [Vulpes lagopus]